MELEWVAAVTGEPVHTMEDLKSGVVLCKCVNIIKPNSTKFKDSQLAFMQRENIGSFLRAAAELGVPDHELFDVEDLYELHNPKMVETCLRALSRVAPKHNSVVVPIGPSLAKKHKPPKPVVGRYAGWGNQYGHREGKSNYE